LYGCRVRRIRTVRQALSLYLHDADKGAVLHVVRTLGVIAAGYAPFAALNDALAPFTFGLTLGDDPEIPVGVLAALMIIRGIHKYRSPDYSPRRR